MKIVLGVVVLVALVAGLLYMQGLLDPDKIGPGAELTIAPASGTTEGEEGRAGTGTATVLEREVPVLAEAVGTVRSRHVTQVSPRIMGTLTEINVNVGDPVSEEDVLARIDVREAEARLAAARAARSQAEAVYLRAAADYRRYTELLEKDATTAERVESATADYESAKAALEGAAEQVKAAEVVVGYAEIRAPLSGVVAKKLADPGDLALPGRPIVVIHDPGELRLEAEVREYLIPHLSLGTAVEVLFPPPLAEVWSTKVEELAPEADPSTRTFTVKAALPADSRARPGNFGRLRFPAGERTALLIPPEAVRRIGQLERVRVVEGDAVRVRQIRTGALRDDLVEVLSGLTAGETVVVP